MPDAPPLDALRDLIRVLRDEHLIREGDGATVEAHITGRTIRLRIEPAAWRPTKEPLRVK